MTVRDHHARETARRLHDRLPARLLPLDVISICDKLGVIISWNEDALDQNEEAVTYFLRGRYLIYLKTPTARTATCRLRWTLAHELGHILLGHFHEYDLTFNGADQLGRAVAWTINREANLFAEELLMPEDFIRARAGAGFDFLRKTCDVSRQSLSIRLKNLGLDLPETPARASQAAEAGAEYVSCPGTATASQSPFSVPPGPGRETP
jgi:Zn-dependent peptidase ImmA (M78 family)